MSDLLSKDHGCNIEYGKERLLTVLKANKIKLTKQRRLVIDIILEKEFYTCKDIYQYASELDPNIGIATIYRMVKTLESMGVLNRKINVTIGS